MGYTKYKTANIASSGTTSQAIRIGAGVIAGLILPSALTSSAITFTASDTQDGTFVAVYDSDGNAVSAAVAASRAVGLSGSEADAFAAFEWIKLVCGSAEAAARVITVCVK